MAGNFPYSGFWTRTAKRFPLDASQTDLTSKHTMGLVSVVVGAVDPLPLLPRRAELDVTGRTLLLLLGG
jgi:hypothetical protein